MVPDPPPSITRRRKVLYRCAGCGHGFLRSEVTLAEAGPLAGDLVHGGCGPVRFAENATREPRSAEARPYEWRTVRRR